MSDAKLYISTRENLTHNIANFNSNLSIYFLLDLLYASYFSLDYENNFNKSNCFVITWVDEIKLKDLFFNVMNK